MSASKSTYSADGRFQRGRTSFRSWITPDGSPGPTGEGGFPAEAGRYHLYVAWNCPWAHRTLLARVLKRLEGAISISVAKPRRTKAGWVYEPAEGEFGDPLLGVHALSEVYLRGDPGYSGSHTVPVLWDSVRETVVSNESAEIIRMLDSAFDRVVPEAEGAIRLYPSDDAALTERIDAMNERVYRTLNNGVYRAGFARTQSAYDEAVREVFASLDALDALLSTQRYLCGDQQTEADWRLFPTLVRFDVAYHSAFRCNQRRVVDYPSLWAYARELYQTPGVAETVRFDIYRRGYHSPSELRNPFGIVPIGPDNDWDAPHGRA